MFEYYAALFGRGLTGGRGQPPPPPADPPTAEDSDESSMWDPCPCGKWGVCRADRHGCAALCRELFPELDRELDAWEAAHGWLYR